MDRSLTVGVVSPAGGGFFFGKVLAGVTRRVARAGGRVVMLQSLDAGVSGDSVDDTDNPPTIRPVAWSLLDGVVVTVGAASPADIRRFEEAGIPVVRACVEFQGVAIPGASGDNVGGVEETVDHLLGHGHTRIGFGGNLQQSDMLQRFETYRSALTAAGHPPDDDWFFPAIDHAETGGADVARRVVESGSPVTAMMFATDRNALGALAEFARLGVDVPGDLAVVGFDGIEAGSFVDPLLATVNQHTVEVAELAASLLIDRIEGRDVPNVTQVTRSTFVSRGSCGCGDAQDLKPESTGRVDREGTLATVMDICASLADQASGIDLGERTGRVLDALVHAATDGVGRSTDAFTSFVESLRQLGADPEMIRRIGGVLSRFVVAHSNHTGDGDVLIASACVVSDVNALLWREFLSRSLDHRHDLEQSLWEQYEVGVQLFEGDLNRTENLDWLASTRSRAGCLAVWKGDPTDGQLTIVDFYDRDDVLTPPPLDDVPIEQFPPRALIDAADQAAGEVTFVIPIRSGGNDWGMLALVGEIDATTSTGREQHSQWASLLAGAFAQRRLEEQLRLGALYDGVTGLPNRHLFLERLTDAIETFHRSAERSYSVVFLDLDEFKLVNDSLGHLAGDDLLVEIANRLKQIARDIDTPARFGGDEFAVLLRDVTLNDVNAIVERMRRTINAPIMLDGHEVHVTATFGIAQGDTMYTDPEDVLRNADIAMYRAKAAERGSSTVFDIEMRADALAELSLRAELRQAFERDEFEVHYQPIWSLNADAPLQFEALIRWNRPELGMQVPEDFLSVLVESGQMVRLGRWIIEQVCRQLHEWRMQTGRFVRASVNVSHPEFWDPQLSRHLVACSQRYGITPGQLVIEITEDVICGRTEDVLAVMQELRRAGVDLHVDDFGTGTSSLHALYGYPVQGLKIDRSFVSKVGTDERMDALVRAIVAMSRALDLEVIAEGVEEHHQFVFLREVGCDRQQGFALSAVLDRAVATQLVKGLGTNPLRSGLDQLVDATKWLELVGS
jgi:diguanylate cyclase (GGDEF)-like protein